VPNDTRLVTNDARLVPDTWFVPNDTRLVNNDARLVPNGTR
jgi:hypothetical protein